MYMHWQQHIKCQCYTADIVSCIVIHFYLLMQYQPTVLFALTYQNAWKITSCWMYYLLPSQEENKWPLCHITVERETKLPLLLIRLELAAQCFVHSNSLHPSKKWDAAGILHVPLMLLHATDCCHIHHGSYPDYLLLNVAVKKSIMLATTKDKKIHRTLSLTVKDTSQIQRCFPIGIFFYNSMPRAFHFTIQNVATLAKG